MHYIDAPLILCGCFFFLYRSMVLGVGRVVDCLGDGLVLHGEREELAVYIGRSGPKSGDSPRGQPVPGLWVGPLIFRHVTLSV